MIKLVLSILINVLFLGNFWACEYFYPGFEKDWAVFIPMDMMQHNFYAVIILTALLISMLKTKHRATHYFIYLCGWLSFFDCMDRLILGIYTFTWYDPLTIILSFVLSFITFYFVDHGRKEPTNG